MTSSVICIDTFLPDNVIESIKNDFSGLNLNTSFVGDSNDSNFLEIEKERKSKNCFISSQHWACSLILSYVERINRQYFQYELSGLDSDSIQYAEYKKGCFYNWHTDDDLSQYYVMKSIINNNKDLRNEDFLAYNTEKIRKLSFSLQLSNYDEYEGGNLQFLMHNKKSIKTAPRIKGSLCIFDSRLPHRVQKVKSGTRNSIVGWCIGPRWK